jgi:hypothetical protein
LLVTGATVIAGSTNGSLADDPRSANLQSDLLPDVPLR